MIRLVISPAGEVVVDLRGFGNGHKPGRGPGPGLGQFFLEDAVGKHVHTLHTQYNQHGMLITS